MTSAARDEQPLAAEPAVASSPARDEPPLAPRPTPPGMRGPSARAFFASLAQRRALRADGTRPEGIAAVPAPDIAEAATRGGGSLDALFGTAPSDADETIAQALATAVGLVDGGAAVRGRPTQAADSELSLNSVFRSESALRSSGPVKRPSEVLKFDQFFAAGQGAAPGAEPDASDIPSGPAAPTDDAQFQAWLQGLKKP
jgi:hypothetical protein